MGMYFHFSAREETGPDPDPRSAERQGSGKSTTVRNASRGYDWDTANSIDHCGYKCHRRDLPTHMATCLPALCNDDVNPAFYCSARVLGGANRMKYDSAARLRAGHKSRGFAPEEGDNRHALLQASVKALSLREL